MSRWSEFAAAQPGLAERVHRAFSSHRHHTMATLRRDGAPRISGTEIRFEAGEMAVGMMAGTRRAADLQRDPRVALHSHTADPAEDGSPEWQGDAKVHGRAREADGSGREPEGADWFTIDIEGVSFVALGVPADHLDIEAWTPSTGLRRWRR